MDQSPIIARIAKALALAKNQAGTPEGETAARIAKNMMDSHAITMADLDAVSREKQDPLAKVETDLGARSQWRRELMFSVLNHCTVRGVFIFGSARMQLFGHSHDIEVAKYLYDVILRQLVNAANANAKALPDWYSQGEKKREYNSFVCSAVEGVKSKLRDIRKEAAKERAATEPAATVANPTGGTALVLKARETRVAEFYETAKGRTRNGPSMRGGHSTAGFETGRNVSLNAGLSAGKQSAIR